MNLWQKFRFYREKYGIAHAMLSYIGRHRQGFWDVFGPATTRPQIRRWQRSAGRRVLNLGGGSNCLSGCFTVDIDARADAYVDITRPLPFAAESVDAIFCEEVIEHVSELQGLQLLRECRRILRPGGVLRLSTPDLNWFARRTVERPTEPHEINEIFFGHGHRFLYTREALAKACSDAGFVALRSSSYKDEVSELGYLDSHAERFRHPPEISQFVDATKPGN